MPKKQSFLERLTGTVSIDQTKVATTSASKKSAALVQSPEEDPWDFAADAGPDLETDPEEPEEEESPYADDEGELAVDMYVGEEEIVIQAMIAGVTPENLHIAITRDSVVIKGKRIAPNVSEEEYAIRELYWGAFARKVALPYEIDTEGAEAIEKYGLLIIRLPKHTGQTAELKVKSI